MTTTDTTVSNLIINTMTQAQYSQITPDPNQLYMVTDSTITSSEVTSALGYTPTSPANVDGQWVSKVEKIVDSVSNTTGTSIYLDSNGTSGAGQNYLPSDNYKYEVMFLVRLGCNTSKSGNVTATFGSDILDMVSNLSDNMMACSKAAIRASVIPTLPIGTSRYFKYSLKDADSNTNFFTVYALGYRRIGTNS